MLSAVIFSLAILVAGGFFIHTIYGRFRLLLAARPAQAFDRISERIMAMLVYAFGQKKFIVGEQPAGWLHFFIFWGFLVLGVQVVTMFGRAYS
ncbi:MAG: (Fe-S)-binding protein, partial [Candidatus Binatia bacterium]